MIEPVYLDSSVVIAYYVPEAKSARVQAMYERLTTPMISELVELELIAGLSLRIRTGDVERAQGEEVMTLFDEHLNAGLYSRLQLRAEHYRWARDAISRFDLPLKSPDALHLAAAQRGGLRLVTADRQLARNAASLDVAFDLVER
ncbi:MAG: type II toxin-antitoxin system VapC family toxin [Chloroflexia bacterium]|nr:type II toxin-antitoxin system VapC family toxin [Chloroflexia bacterium]